MNKSVTQVLVIHGGDTFATYEDYLDFLKDFTLDERVFNKHSWKQSLGSALGEGYEVLLPQMPNKFNAKYLEWKIWFEKFIPLLNEEVILVGHSLGGLFLAKYLAEETYPKKIKGLCLAAAPYDMAGSEESLADFILPASLEKIVSQTPRIFLYQSQDDPIVPVAEVHKYEQALQTVNHDNISIISTYLLEGRGHLNQDIFPELVQALTSL